MGPKHGSVAGAHPQRAPTSTAGCQTVGSDRTEAPRQARITCVPSTVITTRSSSIGALRLIAAPGLYPARHRRYESSAGQKPRHLITASTVHQI